MKKDEVPQDPSQIHAGIRKLLYAVDEKGEYGGVQSTGWEVENYVTLAAVDELKRQAEAALVRAKAGKASTLEYHMYARRMDLATLSATTGIWKWRVARHLKPDVFPKLSADLHERYAFVMGITIEELRGLPDNV
ncbi:MAG: hypothetical protein NVV62_03430 [Terricaulis sp.]|nr:hypothetical protein [Terricaulis sp.]